MTKVIRLNRKRITHKKVKTAPVKRGKSDFLSKIKYEWYKIILLIVSVAALLCGSLMYRYMPNEEISALIREKIIFIQSGGFISIMMFLIKTDFMFLALSFFLGTSFMSASLFCLAPILKCFLIGYMSGLIYNEYELKGVLFCLILIYPYLVVTTSSLIFASNETVYMSKYIYRLITNKNTADDISVRLYLLRYLILFVINTVCAVVNSGLIVFLAPKIKLI
ncbi:MAG: hypothetical protein ACI4N4_01050 [Candidatus Fimenecus sp.]